MKTETKIGILLILLGLLAYNYGFFDRRIVFAPTQAASSQKTVIQSDYDPVTQTATVTTMTESEYKAKQDKEAAVKKADFDAMKEVIIGDMNNLAISWNQNGVPDSEFLLLVDEKNQENTVACINFEIGFSTTGIVAHLGSGDLARYVRGTNTVQDRGIYDDLLLTFKELLPDCVRSSIKGSYGSAIAGLKYTKQSNSFTGEDAATTKTKTVADVQREGGLEKTAVGPSSQPSTSPLAAPSDVAQERTQASRPSAAVSTRLASASFANNARSDGDEMRDPKIARSASGTTNAQPSFDCAKAQLATEQAICRNSTLAKADLSIASMYKVALSSGKTTTREQLTWLNQRNACGDDVDCIARSETDRMRQLHVQH